MHLEIDILSSLRKTVSQQFGKEISTATDCNNLAHSIFKNFGENTSGQTFRRFFGLVKSSSGSSKFTLDILSQFCGFKDYKEFSNSYSNNELERFFGEGEDAERDYWRKSEQLCRQISNSAEQLVNTHHQLMVSPLARKYFMEHHPSRDLIGTVYAQYFLEYLKFNTKNEAKIFAYGFLFKAAFLQENETLMELYYDQLNTIEVTEDVYVIPAGLKYGIQLLYADYTNNNTLFKKYFAEMKKVRERYLEASHSSVCSFEYTVLESLIFTDRKSEIEFLIDNNCEQINEDHDFIPADRKQTHEEVWKILLAAAYQKLGGVEKSQHYMRLVNLENLGVGWQKYYTLMFYFIRLKSDGNADDTELISKIEFLINETHFSYYENELSNYQKLFNADSNCETESA